MDLPISKNQMKKLKRDQKWEEERDKRKARRKEKLQEKKLRKRAAREHAGIVEPLIKDNVAIPDAQETSPKRSKTSIQLPITIVIDCGFDHLMMDKERKSLAAQITRCYSDNHKAPFKAHLAISSFEGHLQDRFDTVLSGHYSSWKDVRFLKEDFVDAAKQAKEWMEAADSGKLDGSLFFGKNPKESRDANNFKAGEIVYLTSDSPHTLTKLEPYSTYIVGGVVDRNRHKGICYKRAMDRGVQTARLPIGDYMQMSSRSVLTTNHVCEIIIRWLELGDWGEAFLRVIPKRKGGTLKNRQKENLEDVATTTTNDREELKDEIEEDEINFRGATDSESDKSANETRKGNGNSGECANVSLLSDTPKPQPESIHTDL